jgi:hypothetical protein
MLHERRESLMAKHVKVEFENRRVDLDGNSLEACRFDRCQIFYGGGDHATLAG